MRVETQTDFCDEVVVEHTHENGTIQSFFNEDKILLLKSWLHDKFASFNFTGTTTNRRRENPKFITIWFQITCLLVILINSVLIMRCCWARTDDAGE